MRNKRNILLLEPNYKNKYPPIGLMKIATYYKILGDNVVFYKGDLKKFVLDEICLCLMDKLSAIEKTINWKIHKEKLKSFLIKRGCPVLIELLNESDYPLLLNNALDYYKDYYKKKEYYDHPQWDIVCISTLFTFHWKVTVETIHFAKKIVKDINNVKVGGVMASVLPEEIEKETGIKPIFGLLNYPGALGDDNDIIIDTLPLDYSLLDEIDYRYPASDAYYGYTTRGCKRRCSYCAVWKIEPKFVEFYPLTDLIKETNKQFGEKKDLLLLDNNVLCSPKLPKIINQIKSCGFTRGALFVEPNRYEITIKNLKSGLNKRANMKWLVGYLNDFIPKVKKESDKQKYYNTLREYQLNSLDTITLENISASHEILAPIIEANRSKVPKKRYVDFNQGVDAREITEEKIKLLSEIPIRPLRIAFDSMKYEKVYVKAVKLAAKYSITSLSNYLLYNENEEPVELYRRLKINIDLCERLKITIYSFPMKYHPIEGDYRLNREFLGKYWNRKYIRAVQTVLNATKGKIGRGKQFFEKAFGRDEEEFHKILLMPEVYILYRLYYEKEGFTDTWWEAYRSLTEKQKARANKIIFTNDFSHIDTQTSSKKLRSVLYHYTITRNDYENEDRKKLSMEKLKCFYPNPTL